MPRRSTTDGSGTEPSTMLRAQHAEATRRAVLAAARSSFGKKGYTQTSVDEIADAARVTKGAVYHHFASKKSLFRAVHAEVAAEAEARAAEAADPEGAPIDQIVARVNGYLDAALEEEIRRIGLIDGPAVLGHELEDSADQQPGHVDLRQSGRGGRRHRRIRADAHAVTAAQRHAATRVPPGPVVMIDLLEP